MSRGLALHQHALKGFPRVSGDEPLRYSRVVEFVQFSPRERG